MAFLTGILGFRGQLRLAETFDDWRKTCTGAASGAGAVVQRRTPSRYQRPQPSPAKLQAYPRGRRAGRGLSPDGFSQDQAQRAGRTPREAGQRVGDSAVVKARVEMIGWIRS